MENQKNSKKLIAIIVAAVVIAAALAGVYFSTRPGSEPAEEITATPEVTEAPTEEPTEAPTEEPTEAPTEAPTEVPTEEPTEAPTEAPTEEPTEVPTEEPVADEEPVTAAETEVGGADGPEAVTASAQTSPDDVMVIVNGEAVNREAFEGYRDSLVNYFSQYGYDMTNADNLAFVGGMAMETLVEDTILFQKAADLGLEITEEERAEVEVENAAQWAEVVDYYMANYVGVTNESTEEEIADARTTVLALLEAMGYTENVMLESTLESMRYEKAYAYMVEGAEVTDADIQAAYEERVAEDKAEFENDVAYYEAQQYYGYESFYTPEGYRGVTHILLEVDQELLDNWQALTAMLEEQQDEAEYAEENAAEEDAADADAEEDATYERVTQEQVDAAYAAIIASVQETIDEIYAKLEAGTPFSELVEAYGTDPGMKVEPTKSEGYAVHMDSILWDPAFVVGAFSVDEVGAVAQPIVGSYGVHIIQYTRDVPAGPVELTEELKASLRAETLAAKENELFEATLATWKSEAEITYSAEAQEMVNLFAGDKE